MPSRGGRAFAHVAEAVRLMEFHPAANIFPMMDGPAFAGLVADIEANGQREPIIVHENTILDGRNRYRALQELGWMPITEAWDGLGDPVAYVVSLNLHRRHLTESQRAMVAARITNLTHGGARPGAQAANLPLEAITQNRAAEMLKVGERSVRAGVSVRNHGVSALAAAVDAGHVAVSAAAMIATLPVEQQAEVVAHGPGEIKRVAGAMRSHPENLHANESVEWYTPEDIIAAAREVLGTIDLDPASCVEANRVVRAERIFSESDDGLAQPWAGRVWMNPPYGRDGEGESNQAKWLGKLLAEYSSGNIEQAIAIVNASTADGWFRSLWAFPICFTGSRIRFWRPGEPAQSPRYGSAIVYLGPNVDHFASVFGDRIGAVVRRVGRKSLGHEMREVSA